MNTVTDVVVPTEIGTAFAGGFYAGRFRIGEDLFALIVAPKLAGAHDPARWNKSLKRVEGAGSYCDGMANTIAMAAAGSALAKWALALSIHGHIDWYLPSRDELELLYRHFKPGAGENWTFRNGDNPSSLPPGYPYTTDEPAQTAIAAFRADGTEAFEQTWYWTSTQCASTNAYAWFQGFGTGYQSLNHEGYELRARAVRRVPV